MASLSNNQRKVYKVLKDGGVLYNSRRHSYAWRLLDKHRNPLMNVHGKTFKALHNKELILKQDDKTYTAVTKHDIMLAKEIVKLLNAGFTAIQARTLPPQGLSILQKTPKKQEWHLLEKDFPSKAALKRKMDELLANEKVVDVYASYQNI